MTSWAFLVLAGLLEIVWAIGMKLSGGFTRLGWSIATLVALAASMVLLALATRTLPIGTAYAVWVGIGAAGTAVAGMIFLGEPVTPARLVFLGLLIASLIGLKLATPSA
jgi:quaternary ammonium compound-resistance protein SugE